MSARHRFPIYKHDAIPGVTAAVYRKSYTYCEMLVGRGSHQWLDPKTEGVIENPPMLELTDDNLISIEKDVALDFSDSENNASGVADRDRTIFRPSGALDPCEIESMQKVRNYLTADDPAIPAKGKFPGKLKRIRRGVMAWSDRIVYVSQIDLA